MSEKIYVRLLRLYPPKFRKEYDDEVLQFIRDRLRDEVGFLKRTRLWWDLSDGFVNWPAAGIPEFVRGNRCNAPFAPSRLRSILQSSGQGTTRARIDPRRRHIHLDCDGGLWICVEPANRLLAHHEIEQKRVSD